MGNGQNTGIRRGTVCVFVRPDGPEIQCRVDQKISPMTEAGDPVFIVQTREGDFDVALPGEGRPL